MKDIHYLVFSGGGAAVYGHAGALLQLSTKENFSLKQIKAVAGASVGTIPALLVSLNHPIERLVELIQGFDLKKLADGGHIGKQALRLFSEYGINQGDELYKFILHLLQEKTGREDPENITFADLKKAGFKDLYVVATKLFKLNGMVTAKEKIFSADKTPHTAVATAILASCAAPGLFRRVRMKKLAKGTYVLDEQGDLYEDGGVLNNFPIDIFDQPQFIPPHELATMTKIVNPHTLGFALLDAKNINDKHHPVTKAIMPDNQPLSYGIGLINALTLQYQKNRLDKKHNRLRTIQIDRNQVKLAELNLTVETKKKLLDSGMKSVDGYFFPDNVNDKHFHQQRKTLLNQFWAPSPSRPLAPKEPQNDAIFMEGLKMV